MTDPQRTEFAMAAVDFAGLFNTHFSTDDLCGYGVRLTAPAGQSTGGGVQALQHITLVREAEGKTMVVGSCNNVEKKAELRTYDLVAEQFQQHNAMPFPVDRARYDAFLAKTTEFLQNQGLQVTATQTRTAPQHETVASQKSAAGLVIGVAVLVLVAAAVVVYFLAFHQP